MLTIIISWAVLFSAIFLVGKLFLRDKKELEWYEYFWAGLVITVAILQVWSIFLPVNIYALGFIIFLSAVSLIVLLRKRVHIPKIDIKFLICAGVIVLSISYFASLTVGWEDTHLYHLNMVKWSNLYPTVPGLANLHDRLGQTSTFFLFASMIDNWFLKDRSSHVAMGLWASVLSVQILWIFYKFKDKTIKIFSLLVLPLIVLEVASSTQVASLSTDLAMVIVALAISLEILREKKESLIIAVLLSALLVTVKFSGFFFAGLVFLFVIFKNKSLVSSLFYGALLFIPFVVRNIILSGWPLFPLPILGVNVPWALPRAAVEGTYTVIKTWAISPGPGWDKSIGLTFWQWFPSWYARNAGAIEIKIFYLGIALVLTAFIIKIVTPALVKKYKNLLILGAISFLNCFYILFTAPDFRFGRVFFWLFFASVGSYFAVTFLANKPWFKSIFLPLPILFIFVVAWPLRIDGAPILRSIRWEQSQPLKQILVKPVDGSPPFYVYEPLGESDLCGNSPLPCTPYPKNTIREIVPGDISKGFAPIR